MTWDVSARKSARSSVEVVVVIPSIFAELELMSLSIAGGPAAEKKALPCARQTAGPLASGAAAGRVPGEARHLGSALLSLSLSLVRLAPVIGALARCLYLILGMRFQRAAQGCACAILPRSHVLRAFSRYAPLPALLRGPGSGTASRSACAGGHARAWSMVHRHSVVHPRVRAGCRVTLACCRDPRPRSHLPCSITVKPC